MIIVDFFTAKSGELLGFSIKGHAGMDVSGKDILCAGVSSAVHMVANTITEVIGINADISIDSAGLIILKIKPSELYRCREILSGFKLHMISLEEQYPENITVNYTEV